MSDLQIQKQQQQQIQKQQEEQAQKQGYQAPAYEQAQKETQAQKHVNETISENKYLQNENDADLDTDGMDPAEVEELKKERATIGLGKHNPQYEGYKESTNDNA